MKRAIQRFPLGHCESTVVGFGLKSEYLERQTGPDPDRGVPPLVGVYFFRHVTPGFFRAVCQDALGVLVTFLCAELLQTKSLPLITKHMLELIPGRIWLASAASCSVAALRDPRLLIYFLLHLILVWMQSLTW